MTSTGTRGPVAQRLRLRHGDGPTARSAGLRCIGDVAPGGGGTLLVAGSHRMVERFVTREPEMARRQAKDARAACHRSNDWLAELALGDGQEPGRVESFMSTETDVEGIPARVVEACGQPGDVFVCHPGRSTAAPRTQATVPASFAAPPSGIVAWRGTEDTHGDRPSGASSSHAEPSFGTSVRLAPPL